MPIHELAPEDDIQLLTMMQDALTSEQAATPAANGDSAFKKLRDKVSEELEALLLKKADAAMVLRGFHLLTQHSISYEPDPREALDLSLIHI